MTRVKFKEKNQQRKFLKKVLVNIACPSIKELSNRLEIPYGSLKCYFSEKRLLPTELFEKLCFVSKIDFSKEELVFLNENWGKIKGGKK
jgi:hypothetical protein